MATLAATGIGLAGMALVAEWPNNLCGNGSFETTTAGWAAYHSTLALSAVWARDGTQSLGVTATAADASAEYAGTVSGATGQRVFQTQGWVYVPPASHLVGLTMQVMVREAGGGSGTFDHIVTFTLVGGIQQFTVSAPLVQNDRTSVHAVFYVPGGAAVGDVFYLDAVTLRDITITGQDDAAPTIAVEVDWTNTGVWVNESANVRAVSISRGRARASDVFTAGTASIVLRNYDGRYAPFNAASPLYPNVVASRPVRITASYHGVSYPQYQGFLAAVAQTVMLPRPEVTLTCVDAFEQFRLANKACAVQTNQRTDQVIGAILDAVGWTGGRTLSTGRTLLKYVQPAGTTLQGLQHAALQDVVGTVRIGKAGDVVFRNAGYRLTTPVYHVFTSVEAETLDVRQADLISEVDVSYNTAVGTTLVPRTTTPLAFGWTPGAVVPKLSDITLTASSNADGTGLNVSQQVWVRSLSITGAVATIGLYSSLPYPVYLQGLSGHGIGGVIGSALVAVAAGPLVSSQALQKTFDYATDNTVVNTWAHQAAAALRAPHPRPVVQVVAKTPELTHILLGADLGSRIVLVDTGGAWLSGMSGQFFIEAIQLQLAPGQITRASWSLFDAAQGTL